MIANHKGEIPIFILLIPFILGITLAVNFPANSSLQWLIISLITLSLIFISLNLSYTKLHLYKHRWIGGSLITIILILAGYTSLIKNNELNNKQHFSKFPSQYLIGKISNEPILKNGWLRFTINVEQY